MLVDELKTSAAATHPDRKNYIPDGREKPRCAATSPRQTRSHLTGEAKQLQRGIT
jgi:hypothetical protein